VLASETRYIPLYSKYVYMSFHLTTYNILLCVGASSFGLLQGCQPRLIIQYGPLLEGNQRLPQVARTMRNGQGMDGCNPMSSILMPPQVHLVNQSGRGEGPTPSGCKALGFPVCIATDNEKQCLSRRRSQVIRGKRRSAKIKRRS
jgi:hypothetical protein